MDVRLGDSFSIFLDAKVFIKFNIAYYCLGGCLCAWR